MWISHIFYKSIKKRFWIILYRLSLPALWICVYNIYTVCQKKVLKKEETIREIHAGCQESIASNEDDVKMIQNLEETVCRLRKEITVLNAKVRAMFLLSLQEKVACLNIFIDFPKYMYPICYNFWGNKN